MDIGALQEALGLLVSLDVVVALLAGCIVGALVGFIPGLGLLVAFALALPFILGADPIVALAFLLGMYSQTTIAGDLTAISFAVPGTTQNAALVVDGYPMTKSGRLGEAIGAALLSSGLGALIGIIPLFVLIPLVRPLVLRMQSPEIFALTVLGVSVVASVSGKSLLKGLAAGGLGFILAAFGPETQYGIIRFGFGNQYLLDGLPLVALAIGFFAIPEVIDLHKRRTGIVQDGKINVRARSLLRGAAETLRHKSLVFRGSLIGAFFGCVPGVGSTVSQWLAYGHAVQFADDSSQFGQGDIRGVIAPSSANNSKEGGELLPTLAFGVPGSPPMALFLAALLLLGIPPGPTLLGAQVHLTYYMLIVLVAANLVGVLIALAATRGIGALVSLPGVHLVPIITVCLFVGAGASSGRIGDVVVLLVAGFLALAMRTWGWPLIPLILAVVLGPQSEQTLWRSLSAFGGDWLLRPSVLGVFGLAILLIVVPRLLSRRSRSPVPEPAVHQGGAGGLPSDAAEDAMPGQGADVAPTPGGIAFAAAVMLTGIMAVVIPLAGGWPRGAALFPMLFGTTTAALSLAVIARDGLPLLRAGGEGADEPVRAARGRVLALPLRRDVAVVLWLTGTAVAVWLLGTPLALGLFVFLYLRHEARVRLVPAIVAAVAGYLLIDWLLISTLRVPLPRGWLV